MPKVVAAKCDGSTCTSLTTDVTALKSCMNDPTATACTTAYAASTTLPAVLTATSTDVTPLKSCMTDPTATACTTTYSSGLPSTVTNLDKCMTDIEDSTCTASYGMSSNLVNNGGKSVVGWIEQLSKYH